jgi:hypothetical protein
MEEMKMYPVRKFNVAEAAYSTNLRLKMQEAEGMVRRIAPSRERSLALTMLNRAKQLVVDYFNAHVDVTDGKKLTMEDVFIVWFSKTLQNWKALVSTTVSDGMYYEITHDGDKGETYLDAYKKWDNQCIVD